LSVREGQGDELDNWLETRAVDMAILFRYRKGARNDEKYLATADTYLVGPPKDILTRSPTIEFSKLAGIPLALPCRPSDWRNVLDDASRSRGFSLSVAIEADSLTVQKQVAIDGRVYAVLGPFSIARELSAGKLQASRIINPEIKRYVTLAVPMRGPTTLACRVVAQHIQQIARSIKWKR
jgi:DNA-binding transcriptional LysR family regulator